MGLRDVIGHVTIRLPGVDFLSVVHGDHASIWHRYEDMVPQILDARTLKKEGKEKKKGGTEGKRKGNWKEKRKGKGKEKMRGKRGREGNRKKS